jgi:hypothetical protein
MKKRFLILSFILFQCTQVFAQYDGRNTDGHDVEARLNTTLENLSLVILYEGGNGDGFYVDQESLLLDPNQVIDLRLQVTVFLQGLRFNNIVDGLMNDDCTFRKFNS